MKSTSLLVSFLLGVVSVLAQKDDDVKVLIDAPVSKDIVNAVGEPPHKTLIPRHKRATCGVESKLTQKDLDDSLAAHNLFRGKELAGNELKLKWNPDLAARAQEWANQCKWEHGMLSDCNGERVGQNLFMSGGGSAFPQFNVTYAIESWNKERNDWDFSAQKCTDGKVCGHWSQLVWAKTAEIGCGYAQCSSVEVSAGNVWSNVLIVACDYTPAGNVQGQQVFSSGSPCSACQAVTGLLEDNRGYKCQDNLCVPCIPRTDSSCQCGTPEVCQNGGSWSALDCICKCQPGFYGVKCEKSCTCEDQYADSCQEWIGFCTTAGYYDFMKSTCPKTCNMCSLPASCATA